MPSEGPDVSNSETKSQTVSGCHSKAPHLPFLLTQIEMTGSFPIDSSTCESTRLFLKFRRRIRYFWTRSGYFPERQFCRGLGRSLSEGSASYCGQSDGAPGCRRPDSVFLPRSSRIFSSVRCLFLALPFRRRTGGRARGRKTGGALCRPSAAPGSERRNG